MSTTATKAIRNLALALAVAGLGTSAALAWKRYGRLDPYAAMAKRKRTNPTTAIQATGVKVRQYQGGKLVASAHADSLSVSADRSGVNLHGIKDGLAKTTLGPMTFQAKDGVLRPNLRTVDVSGGVRVGGKDMMGHPYAFQSAKASIDGRKGQITVPTALTGVIGGGAFGAANLVYRPNADYASLNKVVWQGKVPAGTAPAAQGGGVRTWKFAAENSTKKGAIVNLTDARAEDGEVIVMAPHVEQNTKTDLLTATGRATYRSAKADLVADTIVVHRKEKYAEFRGNVIMYVRPKKDWDKPLPKNDPGAQPLSPNLPPELKKGDLATQDISPEEKRRDEELRSGKTLRDYPLNLKADEVTYWYKDGERHAIAKKGDPTAFQRFDDGRWREAKALQANYDGEKDQLELVGDGSKRVVKLRNSIGDWTDAIWMRMSTKEGQTEDDDDVEAKSSIGQYVSRGDDDELSGATGGAKKTPPTAPPAKTPPPAKTSP